MTKSALPKPIIIDLPYQSIDDKTEIEKAFVEQLGYETLSAVERETLHYIFDYGVCGSFKEEESAYFTSRIYGVCGRDE